MFSLLSGLYDYLLPPPPTLTLLLIGLDSSGKTTLLERIKTLYPPGKGKGEGGKEIKHRQVPVGRITSTIGLNLCTINVSLHNNSVLANNNDPTSTDLPSSVDVQIFDLGGTVGVRGLWARYYETVDHVIYLVDSHDLPRLEESRVCLDAVLSDCRREGVGVSVVVNKFGEEEIMEMEAETDEVDWKRGGVLRTPDKKKAPQSPQTGTPTTLGSGIEITMPALLPLLNLLHRPAMEVFAVSALHGGGKGVKEAVDAIVRAVVEGGGRKKKRRR